MKNLPQPQRPTVMANFYVICQQGGSPYTFVAELAIDGRVVSRVAAPPMESLAVPHCFANNITPLVASGIVGTVAQHLVPKMN